MFLGSQECQRKSHIPPGGAGVGSPSACLMLPHQEDLLLYPEHSGETSHGGDVYFLVTHNTVEKLDWDPSSLDSIKQIVTEDLYMPEGISYAEHEIVKKRQMR